MLPMIYGKSSPGMDSDFRFQSTRRTNPQPCIWYHPRRRCSFYRTMNTAQSRAEPRGESSSLAQLLVSIELQRSKAMSVRNKCSFIYKINFVCCCFSATLFPFQRLTSVALGKQFRITRSQFTGTECFIKIENSSHHKLKGPHEPNECAPHRKVGNNLTDHSELSYTCDHEFVGFGYLLTAGRKTGGDCSCWSVRY